MRISILTEYPLWLIVFCIGLAFLYSYLLYRKDKHFIDLSIWKLRTMSLFRFISVFFISFLLLSPLIKSLYRYIEKPIIIFAQDNSESITINKDSLFYKNEYKNQIKHLINNLSDEYEIRTYTFGENLKKGLNFNFNHKQTDYSELFKELKNKYFNRNVGALIVASDGIYNKGTNPVYSTYDVNFPIYSIALGDTNVQKDIILSQVKYNKIAFLANKFPIQVFVDVRELKEINTQLNIYNNNQVVFSKQINVNDNLFSEIVNIELEATQTGIQHYKIRLTPNNQEISIINNSKDIVIDVIDSKQKILLLANSPHPDIGAIKSALELNLNYEVKFYLINKFSKSIRDYNLVILHQLPSLTNTVTTLLSDIFKNEIPVLFVLGSQSSLKIINNLQTGLQIKQTKHSFDESLPLFNKQFSLFEVHNEMQEFITKLPPLISPFGEYKMNASSNILFYQKIKNIPTNKPLIFFNPAIADNKIGFITGEGVWRWRLNNFLQHSNNELFNELINKIVQYLALKVSKDNFIINTKKVFNENEPVSFEAEVYNESYELINSPEVSIEIYNPENNKFPFVFDKTMAAYRLNAGIFPVGDYSYKASVKIGDKEFNKTGKFTVISVNIEAQNTIANHQLLYQLSSNNQGEIFYPAQLDDLIEDLKNNKDIVPIAYSEKKLMELINLKWLFFLLLALISAEWFFRKFFGSY